LDANHQPCLPELFLQAGILPFQASDLSGPAWPTRIPGAGGGSLATVGEFFPPLGQLGTVDPFTPKNLIDLSCASCLIHLGENPLLVRVSYPTLGGPELHFGIPGYPVLIAFTHRFTPLKPLNHIDHNWSQLILAQGEKPGTSKAGTQSHAE